jgi:hypothetical protein
MVDHISLPPFPERLLEPLRKSLAGAGAEWPGDLTPEEGVAIEAHGMAPLIHHWSGHRPFRQAAIAAAANEALHLRAIREVLQALDVAGIVPIILKGSALAYQIYPAPELRPRGDTDLFIRQADLAALRTLLTRLGYAERVTSGDEHGLRQALFLATDSHECEHAFDVHWSIANPSAFADAIEFEEAASDATTIASIHPRALGLDRTRALLLACLHRVAHHHGSQRLIWLVDIHLLAGTLNSTEWDTLWKIAVERGVSSVVAGSLEAATQSCGTQWVRPAELPDDEPASLYLRRDVRRGRILASELLGLPGWRERCGRLADLAFPPFAYMQQAFGVRHRILLPFFYGVRGVRGALRLLRRVA